MMSYNDERPAHWTPYDRITTAVDDARNMLAMFASKEQLRAVLGPENYERLLSYLECIELNINKLSALASPSEDENAVIKCLDVRLHLMQLVIRHCEVTGEQRSPNNERDAKHLAEAVRLIKQHAELVTALHPHTEPVN